MLLECWYSTARARQVLPTDIGMVLTDGSSTYQAVRVLEATAGCAEGRAAASKGEVTRLLLITHSVSTATGRRSSRRPHLGMPELAKLRGLRARGAGDNRMLEELSPVGVVPELRLSRPPPC